ncbi:GM23555 [Drosophila sechellia]|uniref:GM23555 n=1 Tax=Drosophila sechellia TaxID=7238 RepID=B4HFV3_DROSE|nr:GM23555 [Drosophila sechellia]
MGQLWPLGLEFAEFFKNVTLESLGVSDSKLASAEDELCLAELEAMVKILSFILLGALVLIGAIQSEDRSVLEEYQRLRKLKPLGIEFADYFQNVTLNELSLFDSRLPTEADLLCVKDLTKLVSALQGGQYWAIKMIDAWGGIPSGIFTGNVYDLGNFDECINIKKDGIRGKYCFLDVSPAKILGVQSSLAGILKMKTATCFPASCSATHMNKFVGTILKKILNVNMPSTAMSISDDSCQTAEREPWNGLTILTIVILSVMGVIVAIATLYDYFLVKSQDQLHTAVKLFSARANSRSLFRIVVNQSNPNVIECLHGIRCMSLFWVVWIHQYDNVFSAPNINRFSFLSWLQTPFTMFFLEGNFSVDSFFFIGGFLVSLNALGTMEKNKGRMNVPRMYIRRFIRIFPILAMSILVYTQLTGVLGDGPLFKGGYSKKASCAKTWYMTLLFVVNFANDMCLDHTWYLAVEMQLFLISPILLFALYKWGKKAAAAIAVLIVLLSGCLFATMMVNHYSIERYSRGSVAHFALYPKLESGKPWLMTTLEVSSYYTLTRVGWPLAVGWVVFACMQGHGGMANTFLSSPLWQPISKLSYSIYIWHSFIQEINKRICRTNTYFSNYQVMLNFWSTIGFTVLFSYLLYLLIEAPIGGLDLFLRPKKKSPVEIKPMTDSDRVGEGHVHDVDSSNQRELEGTKSCADQLTEKSQ